MKRILTIAVVLYGISGSAFSQGGRDAVANALNNAKEALGAGKFDDQKAMFDAERKVLRDALKAAMKQLGREATQGQVAAVLAKFKVDNAALIDAQRDAAEALRDAAKDAKVQAPEAVKQLRGLIDQSKRDKKTSREEYKKAFEKANTEDERRGLFEEHLADQRERHKSFRDDLKKLREELRNQKNDADRRVDG